MIMCWLMHCYRVQNERGYLAGQNELKIDEMRRVQKNDCDLLHMHGKLMDELKRGFKKESYWKDN